MCNCGKNKVVRKSTSKRKSVKVSKKTGYQSKIQKEWQALAESQGFTYVIARNKDFFSKIVNHIINHS